MFAAIDGGKAVTELAPDAYTPYVFVMDTEGMLLVHPKLAGKDLKTVAMPIYDALQAATAEGAWVQYVYQEKEKNTYAKKNQKQSDCCQRLLILFSTLYPVQKGSFRVPFFVVATALQLQVTS